MKNNLKRKLVLSVLTGISLFGIANCSNYNNNYGNLSMGVKFPVNGFSIKDIPANTSTISVEVSGEGLLNPITFSLNKFEPRKLLSNIAQGNKNISASAKSEDGTIVASGRNTVNIIAGRSNSVEVILVAVTTQPTSNPGTTTENPVVLPTESSPSPSVSSSPEIPVITATPTVAPTPTVSPTSLPSPTVSASSVSSGGGGGGFPSVTDVTSSPTTSPSPTASNLNVNVTASDGATISPGISITTPTPVPTPTTAV